jgi:hypothetical protein
MNNRKYLTSTGMLLKTLNEDSNNFQTQQSSSNLMFSSAQQQQQQQQQQQHHFASNQLAGSNLNQFHMHGLAPMQTSHHHPHQMPAYNENAQYNLLFNNSLPLNQLPSNVDYYRNANSMQPASMPVPDIMVLPNSTSQQRWQQKNKQQYKQSAKKQALNNQSMTSSSIITELPETFGLPSNQSSATSLTNYSSKISKTTSESSITSLNTNKPSSEMSLDDQNKSPSVLKVVSNDDIEIISENFPVSISTAMINNYQSTSNADESLKSYLSKNYNTNLLNVTCKPQSNFISNVRCLNQLIKDFYESKLRRYKPYSTVKAKDILDVDDALDDDEQEETEDGEETANPSANKEKVKLKQIIVIDDANEEMHKPWITPDLIKLIKHRNLLQSKINENNTKSLQNDEELMKKFKNLRNKVTKLVKKARKDYVNKYGEENINKGEAKTASATENKINDAKIDSTNPAGTTVSATSVNNSANDTQKGSSNIANQQQQPSTNNQAVNTITSQLTGDNSFLKNQSTVMMNLYNTYFNQYIQQYTQQQQSMAAASTENADSYEALQKQATFYAQQQHALQQQLEQSLTQSSQQLIQEIANAAVAKTNQPFILNQFNHQQHHMHHHHHPMMGPQGPPAGALLHSTSVLKPNIRPPPPVMMPNMNQSQLAPPSNMFY